MKTLGSIVAFWYIKQMPNHDGSQNYHGQQKNGWKTCSEFSLSCKWSKEKVQINVFLTPHKPKKGLEGVQKGNQKLGQNCEYFVCPQRVCCNNE
jgi:hypothetical protein